MATVKKYISKRKKIAVQYIFSKKMWQKKEEEKIGACQFYSNKSVNFLNAIPAMNFFCKIQ